MKENINLIKKQIENDFRVLSFIDEAKELYDKLKEQYDDLNKEYSNLNNTFTERKYYAELMKFYDIKVLPLVSRFKNSENTSIFDNRDKELNSKIDNVLEYIKSVIEHLKERFPKLAIPIIKKFEKMQKEYEENILAGEKKLKNNDSIKLGINDNIMLTTLGTPDSVQKLYLKDLELFSDIYLNDTKKIFEVSSKIDEIYENCNQLKDIIVTDESLKKEALDLFNEVKKYYNNYKIQVDNILNEIDLNMVSNLSKLLNQKLLDFKKLEEKMDTLHNQKLVNNKYKLLSEELDSLNFNDINVVSDSVLKRIEKIVINDKDNAYFDKLKAEFYEKCFFITVYQYSVSGQSDFYNSLTEYSKEMIETIFIELVNEKIVDETIKKEILKDYLKNGFSKTIFSKIFNTDLSVNNNGFKNIEMTFLTEEQCFDSSKQLEIFKKRGTIAPISDFAILLGGHVNDNSHYNNSNSLEDRSGFYWTISDDKVNDARIVSSCGDRHSCGVSLRNVGARPALPYSAIQSISSNEVRGRDGILEVEYGEYPQSVASKILQTELENAYKYNQTSIRKTGKKYTTDSREYNKCFERFNAREHEEFEYKGKRYVRVKANSYYDGYEFTLSNGEKYKDGDYVWVEVQPIKWLIDEKNSIALSERILFAGVQFNHEKNYKGDFSKTDIKQFMDKYFAKEIKPIIHIAIAELKEQLNKTK